MQTFGHLAIDFAEKTQYANMAGGRYGHTGKQKHCRRKSHYPTASRLRPRKPAEQTNDTGKKEHNHQDR